MAGRVHLVEVAQMFQRFRAEEFLCDTVLTTSDGELRAHSLILASVSAVFRTAFENSAGPGLHHVNLPDVNTETLEVALHFMYTGSLHLPAVYQDEDMLQSLFNTLKDLGLDEVRLSRCDITFNSDDEDSCIDDNEVNDTKYCDGPSIATDIPDERWLTTGPPDNPANDNAGCISRDGDQSQIGYQIISNEPADNVWTEQHQIECSNQSETFTTFEHIESVQTEDVPTVESSLECKSLKIHGDEDQLTPRRCLNTPENRVKYTCVECQLTFVECHRYLRHRAGHNVQKPFECRQCGKRFSLRFNLVRHSHLHTGERQHLCQYSGSNFIQKASLVEDVEAHHSQPALYCTEACPSSEATGSLLQGGLFTCNVCAKSFTRATTLINHSRLHCGVRPYQCTECDKTFTMRGQLRQHAATHTGERAYVCRFCSKGFTQRGSLAQHERTHTGARPFSCATCSKSFGVRAMLRQHEYIHTGERPHVCSICGKAFAYKENLIVHTRIHTGDKPFTCSVCGSTYTQSHHLKGHMLTHTGMKPFKCDHCDKSYKNRVDLRFHCVRVHQINIGKRTVQVTPS